LLGLELGLGPEVPLLGLEMLLLLELKLLLLLELLEVELLELFSALAYLFSYYWISFSCFFFPYHFRHQQTKCDHQTK
jgi:hypothetical protein